MKRALVISLVCVIGFAFSGLAATLSGSWATDITIDPGQSYFADAITIDTVLTVNYGIGDWTFTSITTLSDLGWVDQDFNVVGVLGAFSISTALKLGTDGTFGDLDVTVGVSIAGVAFGWDFNLDAAPDMTFTASGVAGEVTVDVTLVFGDEDAICDFPWASADIDLGFMFDCVDLSIDIDFTCAAGFEDITFSFGGLVVPNLPWLTIAGSIEFNLTTGKVAQFSPTFDFGTDVCFDLYWDIVNIYEDNYNGFSIGSIELDGVGISVVIGGVTFEALTYWGETDIYGQYPGILNGYGTDYFEAYKISATDDACCGPLDFSLAVFFDEDSTAQLFDVDLFVATVELEVASQFLVDMALEVDATAGFTQWLIGFTVTW